MNQSESMRLLVIFMFLVVKWQILIVHFFRGISSSALLGP